MKKTGMSLWLVCVTVALTSGCAGPSRISVKSIAGDGSRLSSYEGIDSSEYSDTASFREGAKVPYAEPETEASLLYVQNTGSRNIKTGSESECRNAGEKTLPDPDGSNADSEYEAGLSGEKSLPDPDGSNADSKPDTAGERLAVYVCGAVQNPSVCYLPEGARVCDAIEAAGGFLPGADTEWLNQAELLTDAEMLVVYTLDETSDMERSGIRRGTTSAGLKTGKDVTGSGASPGTAVSENQNTVNLNTASKEQLMTLPGIGESKAEAILRYRTEKGYFASPEDVMNISGIKSSVYEKIRDKISV